MSSYTASSAKISLCCCCSLSLFKIFCCSSILSLNFNFCSSAERFALTLIKLSFEERNDPDVDDFIACLDLRDDFDPTDKVSPLSYVNTLFNAALCTP